MYINNNFQSFYQSRNNNVSFQGSVGKSVTKYLRQVRKDVIKTNGNGDINNISHATELTERIMTRLTSFMDRTAPDTEFIFEKIGTCDYTDCYPYFKNGKSKIRGFAPAGFDKSNQVSRDGIAIECPDLFRSYSNFGRSAKSDLFMSREIRASCFLDSLENLDKYTEALVENIDPKKIDEVLELQKILLKQEKIKQRQILLEERKARQDVKQKLKDAIKNFKNLKI